MKGNNSINQPNEGQLKILEEVEQELEKWSNDPQHYRGKVLMIDGPGGYGKTFLLETIVAYCNLQENKHIALCSAFSGGIHIDYFLHVFCI